MKENENRAQSIRNIEMKNRSFLNKIRRSRYTKAFMAFVGVNMLSQIVLPTAAMALTSGASSPEFSSFEPVATTNMVNDFTGDFTYNLPVLSVPGPDGGGYSMSLSYHSGASPEEEASWVGFGWTLNPGAINRNKRGYADDFNDVDVIKYNKVKPNWTSGSSFNFNMEYNSADEGENSEENKTKRKAHNKKDKGEGKKSAKLFKFNGLDLADNLDNKDVGSEEYEYDNGKEFSANISFSNAIRYNNYSGFSQTKGFGASMMGMASLNMNRSGGENTFGFSVNPLITFQKIKRKIIKLRKQKERNSLAAQGKYDELAGNHNEENTEINKMKKYGDFNKSSYSSWSFNAPAVPYSVAKNSGIAYNVSYSLQINPYGPLGFQAGIKGSMNAQANDALENKKAYGYLHNPSKAEYLANDNIEADYQIEKATTFSKHDKHLGIPFNNADVFSATGNGVMGGFQVHHEKIGQFYPSFITNKQQIRQAGVEAAVGGTIQIGLDVGIGFQKTKVRDWTVRQFNNSSLLDLINLGFSIDDINDIFGTSLTPGANLAAKLKDISILFSSALTTTTSPQEFIEDGIYTDFMMKIDEYFGFASSENPYMRFNGDMGSELSYTGNDELSYAKIGGSKLAPYLMMADFTNQKLKKNDDEKRTSYIEYSTYSNSGELVNALDEYVGFRKMNGTVSSHSIFDKENTDYKDLIGQIAVTDKSGNKSTYGLPVFSTEETQLTIGVETDNSDYVTYSELEFDKPLENKTVSGSRVAKPYASTYLLTNTTTFDYIDVDNNGPSEGDFGGWTKFNYKQVHDDYRYRAPYTGLFYNRGRLTDPNDQTGSMSSGKKEVDYLESIETKTHIAYFVTNNTNGYIHTDLPQDAQELLRGSFTTNRPDGLSAYEISNSSTKDAAANNSLSKGSKHLEKLEKIVLYAKNDYSRPISVTYFEYDQSLCNGIPNTDTPGTGKLTLKKVWTEGGGVSKTRIAPYQFKYEYFRDYPQEVTDKYGVNNPDFNIEDVYNGISPSDENPNYKQGLLDMWGNYRIKASERFKNMQPWLDQTVESGTEGYDPAAWQLKQIILPSGGSIHIHYEQKDYLHVQDKRAMIMTPLLEAGTKNTYISKDGHDDQNRYYIDLEQVGITNPNDIEPYKDLLESTFIAEHKKLYFKMLINLRSGNASLNGTESDYVTGYTSVSEVFLDDKNTPLDKSDDQIFLRLGNDEVKKDKTLPRFLAYKKLLTNSHYNLTHINQLRDSVDGKDEDMLRAAYSNDGPKASMLDNDYKTIAQGSTIAFDEGNFNKATRKIGIRNTFKFFSEWVAGGFKVKKKDVCENFNPALSYFKLPTYHSKKGGGVRVKRLLSYDPGIETGDAMVYGSQYSYQLSEYSGLSSGIATNEPSTGREENALVEFLERKPQKWLNKVTKGRDSKQFEGPIGESLLPGASIGYSRVVVKNIHSGKSTTGYAVNEYHTVKDFPMLAENSEISKDKNTYKKFNMNLPLGMINFDVHKAWATQGYLFKLNDMHGKPKSQSTYAGVYDLETHNPVAYTARTTYNYTQPGEGIKSLVYNPDPNPAVETSKKFTVGYMRPGYEEDLTLYRSRVKDRTNDFSLELDLGITIMFPPPITVGLGISYAYSENQFSQHVTSKVLRQKTYLLSTTSTVDGVTQTTENLAFNKHTGDPVLTRTYDGYKGATETINAVKDEGNHSAHYYALNIPASWIYEDLTHKSADDTKSNQLTANVGSVVTYGDNPITLTVGTDAGNFNNVVSASAVVLKNNWFNASNSDVATEYGISTGDVTDELNKHYYPLRSYVFRDKAGVNHAVNLTPKAQDGTPIPIDALNADNNNIYGGGTAKTPLTMFPWLDGINFNAEASKEINNYWFSASKVNKYSPHGVPLEEEDVLKINSTAHFSYKKTLPVLVAQNAKYKEVAFKDYENDGAAVVGIAHSGNRSLQVTHSSMPGIIEDYDLSLDAISRGVTLKLWLKSKQANGLKNPTPNLKATISGNSYAFKRIAQTGEWSLFEARITSNLLGGLTAGTYDIGLSYNLAPGSIGEEVYIDDVRIQPLDAVMNCTVYTKDNRVAAQFDDQHFGVFYEYNREGQLVRKSIETERGRKTVQEQQHNVPMINK